MKKHLFFIRILLYPFFVILFNGYAAIAQYNYGLEVEAHDALIEGKLNLNTGINSVMIGLDAGINDDGDNKNVFVGYLAGKFNDRGSNNVAIGHKAGAKNTIGNRNVSIGDQAGLFNIAGSNNLNIGFQAGLFSKINSGTFIGFRAGTMTKGDGNTFIGFKAGEEAGTETNIEGIPPEQLTIIGYEAGTRAKNGRNTLVGARAGHILQYGIGNTMLGNMTADAMTAGAFNTLLGGNSGQSLTIAYGNTVVGSYALVLGNQSSYNTIIGHQAAANMVNGNMNVFIGHQAGANYNGSEKLIIHNVDEPKSLIYGDFALDQIAINWDYNNVPNANFNVNGTSEFLNNVTINGTTTLYGQSVHDGVATFNDILKLKPAIYAPTVGTTCVAQGAILYGSDDELYFCSSNGWKRIVTQ